MEPVETVTLENGILRVELLPGRGAKLVSLRDQRLGREWLLPGKTTLDAGGSADFAASDPSGFDECLPNVSPGPLPGGGIQLPDHGELWNRPWEVRREGDALVCRIQGRVHPYDLTRRVALDGDTLCLDYQLENLGDQPFPHLWSAHPLLLARPGMRIALPEGVDEVLMDWASDPALGLPGERRPWPGSPVDLSLIPSGRAGIAVKAFIRDLPVGHCALWDPGTGHALHFSWDPLEIPHLGLWLCYGGWPPGSRGRLTVALEPCTGMPDSLEAACGLGCARVLAAGGTISWTLRLRSVGHDPRPGLGEAIS